MSAKKSAEVLIGGRVYTLSGYEEEEYLQQVATYINNKIAEVNERDDFRRLPADMKATLLQLNIADDYFKAKDKVERYEADLEQKDKDLYDLKHDLVSYQVKIEDLEEKISTIESENKELAQAKTRLEASLEDVLLGSLESSDEEEE